MYMPGCMPGCSPTLSISAVTFPAQFSAPAAGAPATPSSSAKAIGTIVVFITSSFPRREQRLLDDLLRAKQERGRKVQAELLGRLEVDHEFHPLRQLDRQRAGRGAREDAVGEPRGLAALRVLVGAERGQRAELRPER